MNRRILIQVTTPGVLIGLLLFVACLAGAWYIDRLQTNMARILSRNVASLQAAQELEIRVRQLRFHSLLNLFSPQKEWRERIDDDHKGFENALQEVRQAAHTPQELAYVDLIDHNYQNYRLELESLEGEMGPRNAQTDLDRIVRLHPINQVVDPSQELLNLNKRAMKQASEDNTRVGKQVRWLMILVGFVGPISGLWVGYAVARGLSRSIYQLSVRVQDMARGLAPFSPGHDGGENGTHPPLLDVAEVSIQADGDMQSLDRQLEHVVRRVEDVAERFQRQQREMLRTEQLSAVGKLAANIAHEVRNPLTSVKMLVEAALRDRNPKPLSGSDLRVIHSEIARLERTVQSFLNLARLPTPKRSRCDLREVVGQAVDVVQARARQQKVEVSAPTSSQPLFADVDQDQFGNVLVNLFLNALDAMPNGGRLEIRHVPSTGEKLILEITDTGPGVSAEIAPRLFAPFVSSKPTGTGLGLSICRRIVEEHGGEIHGHNRLEGGACFVITLPALPSGASDAHAVGD
jgi:two-component system, NtrC family, sensor histidine kinase HydH